MVWVYLLQDVSIICLAITQIVDSFSIRDLRKQVDGVRESKQDKFHKCEEGGSDEHGRRVKEPDKKNAAAGTCGSDKRK